MNCYSCHVFRWFARIIPFFLKFIPGSENSTILSFAGIVIKKKKKELGSGPHLCDPTPCLIICFFCIIDLQDFGAFPASENYTGLIDRCWYILQSAFIMHRWMIRCCKPTESHDYALWVVPVQRMDFGFVSVRAERQLMFTVTALERRWKWSKV